MRFSEASNLQLGAQDDWFDPVLTLDTRLFIDPFLLYAAEEGHFIGSHDEVIAFFNAVFQMIAQSGGDSSSIYWRRAVLHLEFPEPQELCLGYTRASTKGLGSGIGFARVIASALWEAVHAGLREIRHFEEIRIIREGIGADRISDITACLIRHRLAEYTRDIASRHEVPLSPANYARGYYAPALVQWLPLQTRLPRNPYSAKPVLLVPRRYLRSLPTISPEDFWEYCYSNENEMLRYEYGNDISTRVDKHTIVDFARRHPALRVQYMQDLEEHPPNPYNFDYDPEGLVRWYDATAAYCRDFPLRLTVQSRSDFIVAIRRMIEEFRHYVEQNDGWRLLWNENDTPRREEAAQSLFLGIVKHYCRANNIDITREPNIGRGPVDFKVSVGYTWRALLELKLAKNTRFWNGLEKQLPTYQHAEQVEIGFFIVIVYSDADVHRLTDIKARVTKVNATTGYEITAVVVDARAHPLSASKL